MTVKNCKGLGIGDLRVSLSGVFTAQEVVATSVNGNGGVSFLARAGGSKVGTGNVAYMLQASPTTGSVSCTLNLLKTVSVDRGDSICLNGISHALFSSDATLTVNGAMFKGFVKSFSYSQGKDVGDITISCTVVH